MTMALPLKLKAFLLLSGLSLNVVSAQNLTSNVTTLPVLDPLPESVPLQDLVPSQEDYSHSENSCGLAKPSVGEAKEYKVGANSFHIPIMDYLTDVVGSQFEPPISFKRTTANHYLKEDTVQESLNLGFDFMLANPYASSCYQSEGQAVSLATPLEKGHPTNLTQYGAVLYALKERTDIQTLDDIKGKIVGTNKITSLAT